MKKILILLTTISLLISCSKTPQFPSIPRGATVLALGDSLTAGVGTTPEGAYPTLLTRATSWNVVNGGVSGNTSAQALERLPALLAEHQPQFVIVSIGGNDFLQRLSDKQTRENITNIVQLCRAEGAQVLLVGIPQFNSSALAGFPSDHPLYKEIAKNEQIQLYSGGWGHVLKKPEWRSDQVHPNATGYTEFTRHFVHFLKESGRIQ